MPLPPKLFYPICEIASRWSVSPIDIVGWAIDGRITLSAALPLVEAKRGRPVDGLVEISGQEVFDLFDAGTNKKSTVRVQRFRRRPGARWEKIVTPADGVPLKPSGVIIARTEAERFEREHGIFGHHAAENDQPPAKACEGPIGQSGAPARYNWNAFAGAVARRVHDEGMPASQGELVRDMLEWFAASGRVPDESTVRRRVQALWPVLTRRAG
jgi:hypothetical protein